MALPPIKHGRHNKPVSSSVGRFIGALGLALGLTVGAVQGTARAETTLPELGDAAAGYLNTDQEIIIGQEFYRILRNDPNYSDDYELNAYIQNLGDSISQVADLHGLTLTMSLIQDHNINAFAVPGGYITLNTGLLLTTESENELASVVSHEIAHLSQRHIARLVARSEQNKLPALAAILASVVVGGQAGIAGITATTAALASNQLRYSRDFEREADAIGIQLLTQAGYDPRGMADFFHRLEKATRYDNSQIPEFLRTHPLSHTRVAEASARAEKHPPVTRPDSLEYHLARARVRALVAKRDDDPQQLFATARAADDARHQDAISYGTAIYLLRMRDYPAASALVQPLIEKYPHHPWIGILQAELDRASGQPEAALTRYEALKETHPGNLLIIYHLAEALLTMNQPQAAKKELRYHIRRHPDDYTLYRLLSAANVALDNIAEAHQAMAEHHAILGDYGAAIAALRRALRQSAQPYLQSSLQARVAELEEKQQLQKAIGDG